MKSKVVAGDAGKETTVRSKVVTKGEKRRQIREGWVWCWRIKKRKRVKSLGLEFRPD